MTTLAFHTAEDATAAVAPVREHLGRGGLVAYPTETVYGLGSRALDADIAALATLKGRLQGKPFLLLVSSRAMAEHAGLHFTRSAQALADRFWPGPLTLVLRGAEGELPDVLRGPEGGIAVRWTSHRGMATLIRALGMPITSTSANRPGGPTAPGVGAIVDLFGSAIDTEVLLVLDGGVLGNVPPSTLLDCTGLQPRLIREGAIPRRELALAAGSLAP